MRRRVAGIVLLSALVGPLAPTSPLGSVEVATAAPPDVVIAEFMASNGGVLLDEDGDPSDWIELWNRTTGVVDLAGWTLADNGATWTFPSTVLQPLGRVIVWASNKAPLHPLHTNFALGANGDSITLRDPNAEVASQFPPNYPAQSSNISYGLGSNSVTGYLATPTPGEPNSAAAGGTAAKPVLSESGGYLSAPLQLTATTSTPSASLRYTTDGSTPSATNGTTYTGPIAISTTTVVRMVAVRSGWFDSKVASATFLSMDQMLAQTGTPAGWPTGPVNGQVMSYGFDQTSVAQHRTAIETSLQAAPTLSITTDQANLTNPTTGLYVNPSQSGSAWERPASVELIDGDDGFQLNGGLRLKGGSSRSPANPKHNLRLIFEPKYEGALAYPLFGPGGPQQFSGVEVRAEQNASFHTGSQRNTMLRDVWFRDSQAAMGQPGTRSRWVHLFLNGQYWGLYMLKDRISDAHLDALYGNEDADYDVLKHGDNYEYEVNDGDDDEWLQLWDAVSDTVLDNTEYALVDELVDLPNLVDFWLLGVAVGNVDGAPAATLGDTVANNWFAAGGNGEPFRFYVDDGELIMGSLDHNAKRSRVGPFRVGAPMAEWQAMNMHPGWLHEVLLTRPEYRALVLSRGVLHLADGGALGPAASTQRWVERRDEVDPLVDAEAARWGNFTGDHLGRSEWAAEVAWVETEWLPVRTARVRAQLAITGLGPVSTIAPSVGPYDVAERLSLAG